MSSRADGRWPWAAIERRCLIERHLQQRWKAGENDAEELTCSGLAYLERLHSEAELGDCLNG